MSNVTISPNTFNDTTPSAPAGNINITWQTDGSGNLSGYIPAPIATVTSVALTTPAELSVSGSPVTTSGTLALSWANQGANLFFAGPTSGSAAVPAFRGLVNADLPNGLFNTNTAAQTAAWSTPRYITNSNINIPANSVNGIVIGTTLTWDVSAVFTAGTGNNTPSWIIYAGTNGTTADTAEVTQAWGFIGNGSAGGTKAKIIITFTAVGANGAFFWSMSGSGVFGVENYSGTVSGFDTTVSGLIFGVGYKQSSSRSTTVAQVFAQALNLN